MGCGASKPPSAVDGAPVTPAKTLADEPKAVSSTPTPTGAARRCGVLLGDQVLTWDGAPLVSDEDGSQIPLKEVVAPGKDAYTLQVERTTVAAPPGGSLPREDFAELAVQCALRLSRTAEDGAPAVRVVRVSPSSGDESLVERPLSGSTYEGRLAGPKARKRMGVVRSADWVTLLSPFGITRRVDPYDNRVLIDVDAEAVQASPA